MLLSRYRSGIGLQIKISQICDCFGWISISVPILFLVPLWLRIRRNLFSEYNMAEDGRDIITAGAVVILTKILQEQFTTFLCP